MRFEKGHIPWHKGMKFPQLSGKNNPSWKGGKVWVNCSQCNKLIKKYPRILKKHKNYFCNHKCHSNFIKGNTPWNKGLKTGIISKYVFKKGCIPWNKGLKTGIIPKTAFKKGGIPWIKGKKGLIPWNKGLTKETDERIRKPSEAKKGKKRTEEHKHKMSEAHKGLIPWNKGIRGWNAGEKNSQWQGGKSFELYGTEFTKELKEIIRKRDNYKCQLCGTPERELKKNLSIHHIDCDKKNNKESNLISLCEIRCHGKTKPKNKRNYWTKYFQEKLEYKEANYEYYQSSRL